MVLHSVAHDSDLLLAEPPAQRAIGCKQFARTDVVAFAAVGQSDVVAGGNDADHIDVDFIMARQFQTSGNHTAGVVDTMCRVERLVTRQDGSFDIMQEFGIHGMKK